jgi:hypothetical protein
LILSHSSTREPPRHRRQSLAVVLSASSPCCSIGRAPPPASPNAATSSFLARLLPSSSCVGRHCQEPAHATLNPASTSPPSASSNPLVPRRRPRCQQQHGRVPAAVDLACCQGPRRPGPASYPPPPVAPLRHHRASSATQLRVPASTCAPARPQASPRLLLSAPPCDLTRLGSVGHGRPLISAGASLLCPSRARPLRARHCVPAWVAPTQALLGLAHVGQYHIAKPTTSSVSAACDGWSVDSRSLTSV